MPFSRPTLSQTQAQIAADISSNVPGADGLLRRSVLGVLGRVLAGLIWTLYGYLDWIAQQCTPYTATGEFLEAWAALKGVFRKPATAASCPTVQFTGGVVGATVPQGTSVVRSDGVAYVSTADAAVGSGLTVLVPIVATTAGSAGDADSGTTFVLGGSIPNVNSTGQATAPVTGGADVETDDDLRTRMLQAYASPPQGGSDGDYVEWALAVAGVTRAWVAGSAMGPGTVVVYVMLDETEASHGGFPQGSNGAASGESRATAATGDQLTVANAIFAEQPVIALVYVVSPLANPVAFTIAGLSGAGSAVQQAVEAAIADVFLRAGSPGGSVDMSAIESAIGAIAGTAGFVITAASCPDGTVTPGSAGNITSNTGYLPTLGTVTFD